MELESGCIDSNLEEIFSKGAENQAVIGGIHRPKRKCSYFSQLGRSHSMSAGCRNDLTTSCINLFGISHAALTGIPKMSVTCDRKVLFLSHVTCSLGIGCGFSPCLCSRTQAEGADTFQTLWQRGRKTW